MTLQLLQTELPKIGYGDNLSQPKPQIAIISSISRAKVYSDIVDKLTKYNAFYEADQELVAKQIGKKPGSSKGAIIFPKSPFDNLCVITKPPSGQQAKSPNTDQHETYSALCFAAKLRNKDTNYSLQELLKYRDMVESSKATSDQDVRSLFENVMPDDWKSSSIAQTESFFNKENLSGTSFTIERQKEGPITKKIYALADKLIKELAANNTETFGLFTKLQLDKWNPGDIWVVSNNIRETDFDKCKTLKHLNEELYELYLSKKLIGVSLKKWDRPGPAPYDTYNMGNIQFFGKFNGYGLGSKAPGFVYSNVNMVYKYKLVNTTTKQGDAVVRPFTGTDISAEITGDAAAGGKAGQTFINKVLAQMGKGQISKARDIEDFHRKDPTASMLKFYNTAMKASRDNRPKEKTVAEFKAMINKKYKDSAETKYVGAKMQVAEFAAIIETLTPQEKDTLTDMMICYAASSLRQVSSPFVKVGK